MPPLYPSWIEIPAADLDRAITFYRAVFELDEIALYDDAPARIAVLLPSDKSRGNPGVSLVQSPTHEPSPGGPQINFHLGHHAALTTALAAARAHGGSQTAAVVDMGDGVRYVTLSDCEGNTIALSSYEPMEPDEA
jgi:predicted enzyme related to lactoylglutathione lyase